MSKYQVHFKIYEGDYAEQRKGEYTAKTVFTELEKKELEGLAATEALRTLIGMFGVLAATDYRSNDADSFRDFAELGAAIADNAYSNLCECLTGYAELMEERENLSK